MTFFARALATTAVAGLMSGIALAQTSPGLVQGQVPTAAQWNGYFSSKLDYTPSGVPVSSGGTGAITASGARANLGAAASGANLDITSLTGLTTPLAFSEGGCAATSATTCLNGLAGLPHRANNAALEATASTAYTIVVRDGYAAAGDAPSLPYLSSNAPCSLNSGAGDGGSQVPSSDGKCWIADFGPANIMDVRDFGAPCNGLGTTDDGGAFQKAEIAAGNGGHVVFPTGCYINTTVNVTNSITFSGNGQGASLYVPTVTAFNVTTSQVTFRDFYVYGNHSASASNIVVQDSNGSPELSFDNIRCELINTCFDIQGGYFHQAHNIRFRNVVTAGFHLEESGSTPGVELLASGIENDTDTGTYAQPTEGIFWQEDFEGLVLTNSDLIHCGLACVNVAPTHQRAGDDIIGSGVYLDEGGTNGVLLNPTGTGYVTRMTINPEWIATQTHGVYLTGTGLLDDINILAKKIYNESDEGIKDDNSSASEGTVTIRGVQFNGNNAAGGGFSDIDLAPSGGNQAFQLDHVTFNGAGVTAQPLDNILLNSQYAYAAICSVDAGWANATGSVIATANNAPAPKLGCDDYTSSTIAGSSSMTLPTYSGLLLVDDAVSGDDCLFLLGGNSAVLVSQSQGSTCVASTTPTTSQIGVGWSTNYNIYNGFTSARTITYRLVKVRAFN